MTGCTGRQLRWPFLTISGPGGPKRVARDHDLIVLRITWLLPFLCRGKVFFIVGRSFYGGGRKWFLCRRNSAVSWIVGETCILNWLAGFLNQYVFHATCTSKTNLNPSQAVHTPLKIHMTGLKIHLLLNRKYRRYIDSFMFGAFQPSFVRKLRGVWSRFFPFLLAVCYPSVAFFRRKKNQQLPTWTFHSSSLKSRKKNSGGHVTYQVPILVLVIFVGLPKKWLIPWMDPIILPWRIP